MIIGLTGTNGSGKGTVAEFLKQEGFRYYSLSDELRGVLHQQQVEITLPNLIVWGNKIRKTQGSDYLAKRVIEKIKKDKAFAQKEIVIDSIRNPFELAALKTLPGFILIAVDAPIELRYQRVQQRKREDDKQSFEAFKHNEDVQRAGKNESDQQLNELIKQADIRLWNDKTVDDLRKQLFTQLKLPLKTKK
ncbi:TPA: AAA family ATPase [Candidatus Woesearchaeota archaeon]|nr:MAG: hypothetical protein QT07_C0007G0009 [archaeon GW2011_AR16]HIG95493.1 AAA family ATPase [Candidatus Woesearchaeota archaeon]HIH47797.1 AAA family ATPase [Candidatus Woesearchaeota archaeon]HII88116.1 AAA family ATPase [Candidatus Woesearchaeota archaeon]